jgi:CubicO group peptidase (beta-lactamase class C family)
MNKLAHRLLVFLLLLLCLASPVFAQTEPSDAEIKSILQDRVEKAKKTPGIVVGFVSDKGTRIVSFGKPDQTSATEVNGDSIFEIGSVTKVFTSILLEDMAERGKLKLDDPIAKYLPATVHVPSRNGREITFLDLATQTSGLPRMPDNFKPKDPNNPFADYTVEQLYDFLGHYTLTRDSGEKYEYSNVGVGLLGHVLTLIAGTDYETLVVSRIAKPLGMDNTGVKLTPAMQAYLAKGHDANGKQVMNWDLLSLAGAGALRSSAIDMLKFVAANMGLTKTTLYPTLEKTQQKRKEAGVPDLSIAMGWHILTRYGTEIVWHNGGTGGYHSFIGFNKAKHLGVVVLSNSTNDIDDIGRHLLESQYPLTKYIPPSERKAINVDPKILESYVGEYQLTPNLVISITKEGDKMFLQATGQQKVDLFAQTETEFFLTVIDAQISFVKDDKGQVDHLVLHQSGQNIPAKKVK